MKFTWKIAQVRAKEKERKSRCNKRFNEDAKRQVKETAAIIAEAEASVIAMGTDRAIATCTDRACLESAQGLESAQENFLTAPEHLVMPETPEVMHALQQVTSLSCLVQ